MKSLFVWLVGAAANCVMLKLENVVTGVFEEDQCATVCPPSHENATTLLRCVGRTFT